MLHDNYGSRSTSSAMCHPQSFKRRPTDFSSPSPLLLFLRDLQRGHAKYWNLQVPHDYSPVPKADTCTSPRRLHECQYREQAENRRVAQFPTWTRVSHGRNQGRGGMRWKSRALHLSADRVSGAAAERTRPDCDQHGNGWQERGIPRGEVFGCSFKQNILPPQPTDGRTLSGPPGTWGQQPACLHAEALGSRQDRVSSPVRAELEPLVCRPEAAGCSMAAAACREETLGEGNTHPSGQPAH